MSWAKQPGPTSSGANRPHDGWMRQFLRRGAERQAEMLDALDARLRLDLEKLDPERLPSEEWVRAARLRLDGFRALAQLELETAKVRLLAQRVNGKAPMTDEEYEAHVRGLVTDGLDALPLEELEAALERKRLQAADPADVVTALKR